MAGLIFMLAIVGLIRTASKNQHPVDPTTVPPEGKLKWFSKQAKAKGDEQVVIPARHVNYGGSALSTTLDEALSYYTVVIAQPIQEKAYATNPDTIVTWYKFKVVDTLSQSSAAACAECTPLDPPQDLLPIQEDEFLLVKNGGILMIDGVRVNMLDSSFPPFESGKKYLLFISPHPSGVATIGIGPRAIFQTEDGEMLKSINDLSHPVKDVLRHQFGNSVGNFKKHLKASTTKS